VLTLPVVIVAVEEALRAVPRELREASLALGATKWQTITKVVLPNSITGILTGSILAVSRGAGEVAAILFVGVAYSLDGGVGLTEKFMHLGYHLYVLATQSPDVEKALPLQYATTLVLLGLTFMLNFTAIYIRSRLRKKA
jgi:phosphate transport system permease protein